MARIPTLVLMLGAMAALTACAQPQEEVVYMEPDPIMAEPAMTKN